EPCTLGSTRPPRVEPSGAVVRARVWVGGWRVDHAPGTPGQSGCAIGLNHLGWCCGVTDNKRSSLSALFNAEREERSSSELGLCGGAVSQKGRGVLPHGHRHGVRGPLRPVRRGG